MQGIRKEMQAQHSSVQILLVQIWDAHFFGRSENFLRCVVNCQTKKEQRLSHVVAIAYAKIAMGELIHTEQFKYWKELI